MTSDEVRAVLRISKRTMVRWRAEGKGPRVTWLEGRPMYAQADVDEYLRRARGQD